MVNKKTFTFSKIAFYGGRKINTPEITMELRDTDKGPELSICGDVWNSKHTDIIMGGQCLDEMKPFLIRDSLFRKLHRLWKKWHLNGMHPGTVVQEQCLESWHKDTGKSYHSYDEDCKYLESQNLLIDNGYKYGTSWLYREIDEADMNEIKSLLEIA